MSSLPQRTPESGVVSVVICADHSIFRDGLRRLLETDPAFRIVGEACDASTVVTMVGDLGPDLLLLSAARAWGTSRDVLQQVLALGAPVRTIVLAGSMESERVNDALRLGASRVIPKEATEEVLFDSIESVMAGPVSVGRDRVPDGSASVRRSEPASQQAKAFGLTSRELEIVAAVVAGETNKAIALRCSISENTVKRHLMHIFDKVGASTRVELAIFASYHQLVSGL